LKASITEFIFEYDLSIVCEPINIARVPQRGAIIVNPGYKNRNGNPNPHMLLYGFYMWSKNSAVSNISSDNDIENIKNQKFNFDSGALP
jgi:hypothetical protein